MSTDNEPWEVLFQATKLVMGNIPKLLIGAARRRLGQIDTRVEAARNELALAENQAAECRKELATLKRDRVELTAFLQQVDAPKDEDGR